MTALLTPRSRSGSEAAPAPRTAGPSRVAARRSGRHPGRVLGGLLLLVVCVIASMSLYGAAAERTQVIALARDVPAGAELAEADLDAVSIGFADGLATIPAERAADVIGKVATVDLAAASLLVDSQLSDGSALPDGTVIVGAVLKDGQSPLGLSIGDDVELVEVPAAGAIDGSEPMARGRAVVLDLADDAEGQGARRVSLAVARDDSKAVAAAGADGRLSLIVVPR